MQIFATERNKMRGTVCRFCLRRLISYIVSVCSCTLILNNGALIYSLSCSAENTVADSREGNGYSAAALEEIDRIRSTLKEESIDAKTAVTLLKKLNSILGNEPVLSYVRMLLNMDPIEAKEHANKLGYKGLQRERQDWISDYLLTHLGRDCVTDLRQILHKMLRSDDPSLVLASMNMLFVPLADPSLEMLLRDFLDSPDETISNRAAIIMGELCSDESIPYLLKMVEIENGYYCLEAAGCLALMHVEFNRGAVRSLANSSVTYSPRAIEVLALSPTKEDVAYFLDIVKQASNEQIMYSALEAIKKNLSAYQKDEIQEILNIVISRRKCIDKSTIVVQQTISLLSKISSDVSEDVIAEYLVGDYSDDIKETALINLGIMRSRRHMGDIVEFLSSENPKLMTAAILSVERILSPSNHILTKKEITNEHPDLKALSEMRRKWWEENKEKYLK